ncbi:MAG: sulfurtransferase TusA family protein [Gammaproteobacteria bacterium]|nr:sulfurtransferase TusA family protein [Gammaproteobacteria bacterium]
MSENAGFTEVLNARGLLCPMPVIKTQNIIKTLSPGDTLLVISTDPGVKQDIPTWCRINGHEVLEIKEEELEILISILVKE